MLTSSRMPAAIYPIQEAIGFRGPIISYGGAFVEDEDRKVLESIGFSRALALELWREFPPETEECCFCAYSGDIWTASDAGHPLIRREEEITSVYAASGSVEELIPEEAPVHKLWGVGPPKFMDEMVARLQKKFPQCMICKSAQFLLGIIIMIWIC